jgi:hypothetical protein
MTWERQASQTTDTAEACANVIGDPHDGQEADIIGANLILDWSQDGA